MKSSLLVNYNYDYYCNLKLILIFYINICINNLIKYNMQPSYHYTIDNMIKIF